MELKDEDLELFLPEYNPLIDWLADEKGFDKIKLVNTL